MRLLLIVVVINWFFIFNDSEKKTNIIFENKIVKLDSIEQGTIVKGEYSFKNIGQNDLVIEYVNPDCICTGYRLSDSIICPDDWGVLELEFDTKKDLGNKKLVAIMKANTECKFYKLILKVNIIKSKK
ncbi:DUF1573 domain-containing protein [Marinifilum sp.]|uniref:DUF1573 domain-containing protein n=1 Tax=Marinifilum sp. TaxID=2033137 RepID=UPI003BACCE9C